MAEKKTKTVLTDVARVVTFIGIGVCAAISYALYTDTLIDWYIPVGVAAAFALFSAGAMYYRWRWLTGNDSKVLNFCCHSVVVFIMLLFVFFGGNYWLADDSSEHTEQVTVEKRYRMKHNHTRRVRRGVYVPTGSVYYTYSIDVRFSDGRVKSLSIPEKRYRRIRTGSTIPLEVEMGFFGVPVVRN